MSHLMPGYTMMRRSESNSIINMKQYIGPLRMDAQLTYESSSSSSSSSLSITENSKMHHLPSNAGEFELTQELFNLFRLL